MNGRTCSSILILLLSRYHGGTQQNGGNQCDASDSIGSQPNRGPCMQDSHLHSTNAINEISYTIQVQSLLLRFRPISHYLIDLVCAVMFSMVDISTGQS